MLLWYCGLLAATAIYNWPQRGLKNFPGVDLLNQLGYLLVFELSSTLNHAPRVGWAVLVFGSLFAMHSHLLSEIMDVVPDRRACRQTTALIIGVIPSKLLVSAFLIAEAGLLLLILHHVIAAGCLACAAIWFVIDVFWIFRDRTCPRWFSRGLLLGWNCIAAASL